MSSVPDDTSTVAAVPAPAPESAPKVSVIIPVYNTEKYLRECLDSVLNQSLRDIEIICVDDGSTDSSPQILEEYAKRDSRVKILRQQNKFAGVARNNGMKIARGEYLCFLDSDDTFASEMLEKMVARAEATGADIVCCDFKNEYADNPEKNSVVRVGNSKYRDGNTFSFIDSGLPFGALRLAPWNKIFRREFVAGSPLLTFLDTRSSNDLTFVCTAFALAERVAIVPEAFPTYRRVADSSISKDRGSHQDDSLRAWTDLEKRLREAGVYEKLRERVITQRVSSQNYELGFNPNAEFLEKIYETFPDTPFASREKFEMLVFGKVVSPKVSVIVPVYNTENYLRESLGSIVGQTLKDIEIICVDDGSTDTSPQILEEYAARDSRVKILRQQNKFAGVARNNGMKVARGKYLCFLDSDDTFAPEMLEKMVARAEATDAEIVCCDFRRRLEGAKDESAPMIVCAGKYKKYREGNATLSLSNPDLNVNSFNVVVWNKIFHRDFVAGTAGLTFLETRSSNDLTFVYVALSAAKRIAIVPELLLLHLRFRNGGISETRHVNQGNSLIACVEIEERLRALGLFEKMRERMWMSRMWTLEFELGLNPNVEFLEKIYATFPQMSWARRKHMEERCFGKVVSPKVSVIIPVYNTEKYLRECLDSVVNQSLRDIEIICVDDGSTDSSPQILEEYMKRDSRVKVFRQENSGQGAARNAGVARSRGEYTYFMDSDDISPSGALKKMYERAEKDALDVLFFSAESFFETKELEAQFSRYKTMYLRSAACGGICSGSEIAVKMAREGCLFVSPPCMILRADLLRNDAELRFPEKGLYEDNLFFYRLLAHVEVADCVSDVLFLRRVRSGSTVTEVKTFRNFDGYSRVVEGLFALSQRKDVSAQYGALLSERIVHFGKMLRRVFCELSDEDKKLAVARIETSNCDCLKQLSENVLEEKSGKWSASVPAYRPPRQYPRIFVRLAALFIFNKAKRKRFRERHMDLNPRDGIDINAMTDAQRRELERKKSGRNVVRRLFNSIVPATRSKTENTERHILRDNEARSNRLLAELRTVRKEIAAARAETEKRLSEQSKILASARAETEKRLSEQSEILASARESLAGTREELSATRAELASARAETEKRLSELSKKTEEARKQSADALAALRKELSDARKELDSARKEIAGARTDTNRRIAALAGTQPKLQTALTRAEGRTVAAAGAVAALVAGIRLEPTGTLPRKIQDWYFSKTGKPLNLAAPKTYCEKMQWLKAYDVTPEKTRLTDKLAVREWVAEKVGEKYVVPVLGVWNAFDEIDFGALPQQFVLKAPHGSYFNIVVPDKSALDLADAKRKFGAWLAEKYEFLSFEMHYAGIPPRIIAEPFLEFDESGAPDWQVFCFNGKPEFVLVILGGAHADDHGTRIFYDLNWKKLPFTRLRTEVPPNEIPRPENLDEMLAVAGTLCRGFRHVCVDFFRLRDGSWRFAEMTFTRASGLMEVFPPEYDRWIGDKLVLPTDADAESAGGNA